MYTRLCTLYWQSLRVIPGYYRDMISISSPLQHLFIFIDWYLQCKRPHWLLARLIWYGFTLGYFSIAGIDQIYVKMVQYKLYNLTYKWIYMLSEYVHNQNARWLLFIQLWCIYRYGDITFYDITAATACIVCPDCSQFIFQTTKTT
jgi:hypothetical protein